MVVRWLFSDPAAWERAMDVARKYPENPHTVADTLHEQIVPRPELEAIARGGGDPAKVNWLEIAHELIERRDDPLPAQEHAGITAQLGTISAQMVDLSAESRAKAHATAHATASATAKAHARADRLRELRDPHTGEWIREDASSNWGSKTKLEAAATGRRLGAVRLHDHMIWYKTELDPRAGGMVSHVRPGEVVALGHHYEQRPGYHAAFDYDQWKPVKTRNKKIRHTDFTLRLDDGEEVSDSGKDGSTVQIFPREDVAAAKKLAAAQAGKKPATPKPAAKAAPEKTIAQQVAEAVAEGDAYEAQLEAAHAHAVTWDDLAGLVVELSAASRAKAHATASATARRTASEHAKAKLAGELRNEHGEWAKVGALVAHQDGTVTGNAGKVQVGTLTHEGGKWVAHHGDGSVSKHAVKAAALKAMAARHNKAGAAPEAAVKPPPAPVPAKAAPVKTIAQQASAPAPPPPAGAALTGDKAYQSAVQSRGNLSGDETSALTSYGFTAGYTTVNPYLHHDGQVFDVSKKAYVPASPDQKATAEKMIKGIDSAFLKAAPLKQPVTVYRGTGNMGDLFGPVGSMTGKTFTGKAYTSTTTVPQAAGGNDLDYETKQGKLEISVPAGSKVVTGNDFEHEVILPRNAQFSVLSDEMDGSTRHVKLQYQPDNGKLAADAAESAAAVTPADAAAEAAGKLADDLNMMAALGGKSTQKAVLKKNSLADLHAMDAEYARRGAASGKITGAHQLVKDEIASRGATPLPAPSPDAQKAAYAATRARAAAAAVAPATKKDLITAWSHSYRYTGTTEGKDKRTAAFATELHRLLSTNKPPATCGLGCQDAHEFLAMVDQDATPQDREMQRGITLSDAAAQRMFQPGKTMDMPVTSWTTDPETAASYAKGEGKAGKTKVVLHAAPGAKGLDISALSYWNPSVGGGESEVVTGGRYTVSSVKNEGGVMNVYMAQQGFSAH